MRLNRPSLSAIGALIVVLLAAQGIQADETIVIPSAARELVRLGLDSSLTINRKRYTVEQRRAQLAESNGQFLPEINLSGRWSELENVLDIGELVNPVYATLNELTGQSRFPTDLELTTVRPFETKALVTQPLFNTNVFYGAAIARSLARASQAELEATRQTIVSEILVAYYRLNQARQQADILDSTILLAQEALRVAEKRLEAGDLTPEAVFAARADLADVRQQAASARQGIAAFSSQVNQLLHRDLNSPISPLLLQPPFSPLLTTDDAEWRIRAMSRAEIKQLTELSQAAKREQQRNQAAILPEIGAAFEIGYQGNGPSEAFDDDPYWAASVTASWPLFTGGKRPARTRAARAARQQVEHQQDETTEQITLQTQIAYDAALTAQQNLETARERRVAAAENYRLTFRQFAEGAAPSITLLDARTRLTSAAINQVLVGYAYEISLVQLHAAAGSLPIELLQSR